MDFIYSKHFKYFFGLLVLAAVLVLMNSLGWLGPTESVLAEVPRPIVKTMYSTGKGIGSFFSVFVSVSKINEKNAQLQQNLTQLQEQVATLQEEGLENQLLRQELDYRSSTQFKIISASVIGKDQSGFSQTIVISSGSKDGVIVGDAVEAQGAFIGTISSVSDFNSKVLLITDAQSTVDSEISSSGDKGILRGSYGSGISIGMISQTSSLVPGDSVVTAGLTGETPEGLLIGSIGEIQSGKNQLLQSASVIPAANFNNLIFVGVVEK